MTNTNEEMTEGRRLALETVELMREKDRKRQEDAAKNAGNQAVAVSVEPEPTTIATINYTPEMRYLYE